MFVPRPKPSGSNRDLARPVAATSLLGAGRCAIRVGTALLPALALVSLSSCDGRPANATPDLEFEVPPGFVETTSESEGWGRAFYHPGRRTGLVIWSAPLTSDLASQARAAVDYAKAENGLDLLTQEISPRRTRFVGDAGEDRIFQTMILLCDERSYGAMRMRVPKAVVGEGRHSVERLERSLRSTRC